MGERIRVDEKQLSSAMAGWLKRVPKRVWEQLIEHRILSLYKRQNSAPSLESEIARHIASEMTRLDWQVTHPAPEMPASPPPYSGAGVSDTEG